MIGFFTAVLLLVLLGIQMYRSAIAPDTQCTTTHATTSSPPAKLESAMDYFYLANYEYDRGNCKLAINHYSISLMMNPVYPQAYNNRAYTYMRMKNYKDALPDLEEALALNPDYTQALMNRGDIYNYYYQIDRAKAIADYKKVLSIGGVNKTSVCGHLYMAKHNGWNWGTVLSFPLGLFNLCR